MLPKDFAAVTLTPGAYLKHRRTAAGLSIDDVAQAVATMPAIPDRGRAEWLKLIEADAVPASWPTIVALRQLYAFDLDALERLSLIAAGENLPPPVMCAVCAETREACLALGVALTSGRSVLCLECVAVAAWADR